MKALWMVGLLVLGTANAVHAIVLSVSDKYDHATFALIIGIWLLHLAERRAEELANAD